MSCFFFMRVCGAFYRRQTRRALDACDGAPTSSSHRDQQRRRRRSLLLLDGRNPYMGTPLNAPVLRGLPRDPPAQEAAAPAAAQGASPAAQETDARRRAQGVPPQKRPRGVQGWRCSRRTFKAAEDPPQGRRLKTLGAMSCCRWRRRRSCRSRLAASVRGSAGGRQSLELSYVHPIQRNLWGNEKTIFDLPPGLWRNLSWGFRAPERAPRAPSEQPGNIFGSTTNWIR